MLQKKYIGMVLLMLIAISASAQKAERDFIRKGNRFFKDSVYVDAEVNYRKALEANPKSAVSMFNLGNTLARQNKWEEALEQYVGASKVEKEKPNLAQIYHNMGVLFHSRTQKDYAKAVEAYKQSLRYNPKDNETRYNLALAQKMLKDQQQDQKKQDQNKDQEKQDQQKKQDQKKDQDKQRQSQPEKKENEMSKENAEQLLNSVMQDEKDVQDKVKKKQVIQGNRLEKDW